MVQHVVLCKWKPSVQPKQEAEIAAQLKGLQKKILGILNFTCGPQSSPEGLGKGYQFGFIVSFIDTKARDAYLPHPEHQKVVEVLLPLIEDVIVFDYET